jgi:pimeloyl-ACP methyl ester carboxylesterase
LIWLINIMVRLATVSPPLSPYGTFAGDLFQYARNLVAFESSPSSLLQTTTSKKCILIGGLSDGLIPTPYTQNLEQACHDLGWSLVQPISSSSYLGFGNGSLQQDSSEIGELMAYLHCHRSAESFALVGHSTGCQNSIHFLKHGPLDMVQRTKVVALQAPASDREQPMSGDNRATWEANVQIAQELVTQNKGDEMMPRHVFWAPITAQRFLDLQQVGGADDFFSSDFTADELVERLGHVSLLANEEDENESSSSSSLKVLVAYSGADEYVPSHIDKRLLTNRLVDAMNHHCNARGEVVAQGLFLETANHNLSQGAGEADTFVQKIAELLRQVK